MTLGMYQLVWSWPEITAFTNQSWIWRECYIEYYGL